ncbi:MAG: GPR endopeptidase [Clostridia bacterium]|nr:GPR endopeptidase [Clostridia bacterium]
MNFRTDLALERHELSKEKDSEGVSFQCFHEEGMTISRIEITSQKGADKLQKPIGKYITLEIPFLKSSGDILSPAAEILAREIRSLLPSEGTVLVAGLGNDKITPDALGPECIEKLLATRHISPEVAQSIGFSSLRSVAGIVPGVLGNTGIETAEILEGITEKIKPCALIVIDALASRSLSRLGTTIQMCDTGVSPGAGVGNKRSRIDEKSMGVPVIAIGVPTVVDGVTMTLDILEKAGIDIEKVLHRNQLSIQENVMVTPKEIDNVITRAAGFIALGINKALQWQLPLEDLAAIVG